MRNKIVFKANPLVVALAAALGGMVVVGPAFAQTAPAPEPQQLQRVEVTGSSIKRIEGATALPVTVLKRVDIDRTGASNVAELVDKLSSNNGGGYNISSAIGDAARPGFAGASLRALGSNNTLVLLNGRRLSIFAFDGGSVSLNDIPLEAIDRVEILRDGASHLYGTDAVAGVINLITRGDYYGGQVSGGYIKSQGKGGDARTLSFLGGIGDLATNGWNFMLIGSNNKVDSIKAADRSFSKTAFIPLEGVNKLSGNSFPSNILGSPVGTINPTGAFYQRPVGFTPTVGLGSVPGQGSQYGCLPPVSYSITDAQRQCRFDYASVIDITPDAERSSVFARGTFNINANHSVNAEISKARAQALFRISPTPISSATTFNGDPVLLPTTSAFYPTAFLAANAPTLLGKPISLAYRGIETGPRQNEVKSDQDRIVLEAKGSIGTVDYVTAFLKARSTAREAYKGGYILESKIIPAFATGKINPFGLNTGEALALLQSTQYIGEVRESKSTVQIVDGRASTELFKLPGGTLAGAIGFEARKETFADNPGAILNAGDIIGGGGSQLPVAGNRTVKAVYGELNIPITETIEALVAARYDKYSDFGNTTNPKLALRWAPSKSFLVRSAIGTGFRAPTLDNLFSQVTQTNSGGSYNDPFYNAAKNCELVPDPNYCDAQLTVKQGGNVALNPEKSKSITLGVLIEPTKDFSFGADFFQIKQRDLIGFISPDFKLDDYIGNFNPATRTSTSIYSKDVFTKVVNGVTVIDYVRAQFENLGEQITRGVDLSVKFKLPKMESGDYRINWDATYLHYQANKNPGDTEFSVNQVGKFARNGPTLRWKHRLENIWSKGPWEASLSYNFQSGYHDQNAPPGQTVARKVGNYETVDLGAVWTGVKNLKIRGFVSNVFNQNPPFSNQGLNFQVGYEAANTNPRGRAFGIFGEYKFF